MRYDRVRFRCRSPHRAGHRRVRLPRIGGLVFAALFLVGLVLVPTTSAAAADFVFAGRGNGHGMGMSQWGAWQAAREGKTFGEILYFYYPGTTLEPLSSADSTVIKVRVSSTPWKSNTTSFVQVDLVPTVSSATLRLYTSTSAYTTQTVSVGSVVKSLNMGGQVRVTVNGSTVGYFDMIELVPGGSGSSEGRIEVALKTMGGTQIDPREYWGTMRVQDGDDAGELWLYNFVLLEKYVRSIAEVEYDWATVGGQYYAMEAVKAQAVAARTYAVAKNGATIADNWLDQCYRGYSFEAKYPGIAQAAQDTSGLILTYQGSPVTAYFSGHSGGYTTNSAWSGTKPPYIVARADPWSLQAPPTRPGWSWTYTVSAQSLSSTVNGSLKDTSGNYVNVGLLSSVEIVGRDTADPGSHATRLRLTGSNGSATVSVVSFRSVVGSSNLPSTLILTINGDPGSSGTTDPGYTGGVGGGPLLPGEFYDVGPDHPYHDEISRVVVLQLLDGSAYGLFKPEDPVKRWQFAKIAVNLHNLMHPDDLIAVTNVTSRPFDDVAVDSKTTGDVSDWVAAAKKAGLVTGVTSSSFAPYTEVRRDQMATMLCRALGWEDEAAALPPTTLGFSDLPPSSVHWGAATYLNQLGILLGYGDSGEGPGSQLRPGEPIKRQHVAVVLCRVLDLEQ